MYQIKRTLIKNVCWMKKAFKYWLLVLSWNSLTNSGHCPNGPKGWVHFLWTRSGSLMVVSLWKVFCCCDVIFVDSISMRKVQITQFINIINSSVLGSCLQRMAHKPNAGTSVLVLEEGEEWTKMKSKSVSCILLMQLKQCLTYQTCVALRWWAVVPSHFPSESLSSNQLYETAPPLKQMSHPTRFHRFQAFQQDEKLYSRRDSCDSSLLSRLLSSGLNAAACPCGQYSNNPLVHLVMNFTREDISSTTDRVLRQNCDIVRNWHLSFIIYLKYYLNIIRKD